MTLGQYIADYRREHSISIRGMSTKLNLSPTYISRLERGIGSTGKAPSPTLTVYKAVAAATGVTLDELLYICEDDSIVINEKGAPDNQVQPLNLSSTQQELIQMMGRLSEDDQRKLLRIVRAAFPSEED